MQNLPGNCLELRARVWVTYSPGALLPLSGGQAFACPIHFTHSETEALVNPCSLSTQLSQSCQRLLHSKGLPALGSYPTPDITFQTHNSNYSSSQRLPKGFIFPTGQVLSPSMKQNHEFMKPENKHSPSCLNGKGQAMSQLTLGLF